MDFTLTASSSPHIKGKATTQRIMLDVIIALLPAVVAAVYYFRLSAVLNIVVAVVSAVIFEYLWNKGMKKQQTVGDFSAVITGLLLALSCSPATPWWMMLIGSAFAILIVKQLFGGIGMNFLNPALAARAFLLASWPGEMTVFTAQGSTAVDAVTSSTPLQTQVMMIVGEGAEVAAGNQFPSLKDLFLGNIPGSIGETCALALLIGAAYLLIRKVISWEIPAAFIGGAALLSLIVGIDVLFNLLAGGLLLGAFFMATDYTTSPATRPGKLIFGFGCGLLTILIRRFGGYPEGVSYAILLMNLVVPLINKALRPKSFGSVKEK